jgi:hypothetical protein
MNRKLEIMLFVLAVVFVVGSSFAMGWFGNVLYKAYDNKIQIQGLWFKNWYNETAVKDRAYEMDNSGEWVLVNVNKDMEYKDIVDTCEHEAAHELFARKCTAHPEVCFKLMEKLENETS